MSPFVAQNIKKFNSRQYLRCSALPPKLHPNFAQLTSKIAPWKTRKNLSATFCVAASFHVAASSQSRVDKNSASHAVGFFFSPPQIIFVFQRKIYKPLHHRNNGIHARKNLVATTQTFLFLKGSLCDWVFLLPQHHGFDFRCLYRILFTLRLFFDGEVRGMWIFTKQSMGANSILKLAQKEDECFVEFITTHTHFPVSL